MFTSDVLSAVHSVSWSAHSVSRPMPLSRGSTVAAQLRWFPMTGSSQCHRRPQCLQNFVPRLGHAWRPGPAHTQGVSRTQLVCRVQVSPTLYAKFHVDCTVNNMKNPRCATVLSIRYVGLLFVILISFVYDMYFAVIVIWLCICLDPWSIKNYYYYVYYIQFGCSVYTSLLIGVNRALYYTLLKATIVRLSVCIWTARWCRLCLAATQL